MNTAALIERRQLRRKVQGIAAALLPYESNGNVAVEAFQQHLIATHHAGLMSAVNMDTGYVNYLSEPEKRDVLRWTIEALGKNVPFVAGAYIENQTGDTVALSGSRWIRSFRPAVFRSCFRLHGCMVCRLKRRQRPVRLAVRDIRMCWLLS
jgi:hypothetical protein